MTSNLRREILPERKTRTRPRRCVTVLFSRAEGFFDRWIEAQLPKPKWTPLIAPEDSVPANVPDLPRERPRRSRRRVQPQDAAAEPPAELPAELETPPTEATEVEEERDSPMMEAPDEVPRAEDGEEAAVAVPERSPPPRPPPTLPGCRGGHQMVIDSPGQAIYLFGGWDGHRDLSDFWRYDISSSKWSILSADTKADGGPSARSCHKMVLDSRHKHIFVLGSYVERASRDSAISSKVTQTIWTLLFLLILYVSL